MNRLFVGRLGKLLCLVLFLLPGLLLAHGDDPHAPIVISVTDQGFVPAELTVTVGETVTFENDSQYDVWPASDNHPTHEEYSAFDPARPLLPNSSWSFTFDEAGEWSMHDHLTPDHMGVIYVIPEAGGAIGAFQSLQDTLLAIFDMIRGWFTSPEASGDDPAVQVDASFITDFTPPRVYEQSFLQEYQLPCAGSDFSCVDNALSEVTAEYGPLLASEILEQLLADGSVHSSINDHQLSHKIGRNTARAFGVNPQSFELCPTDMFNGGCQHGFLSMC